MSEIMNMVTITSIKVKPAFGRDLDGERDMRSKGGLTACGDALATRAGHACLRAKQFLARQSAPAEKF
jgi:hypothetical protein